MNTSGQFRLESYLTSVCSM